MKEWELIDSTEVPGGQSYMRLMRRGDELVIRVDGRELMSTRMHGSEDALADLAIDALGKQTKTPTNYRILIGGMGIGFTLAAALKRVSSKSQITVAELVPAVIEWNRGILGESAGHPIDDPRVAIYKGDVADEIRNPQKLWDAILLDVDNGPEGLTKSSNDWLYTWEGLKVAHGALVTNGILAIWSAAPNDAFTRLLNKAGFKSDPIPVRARGNKGGMRHIIWICERK